MAEWTQSHVGHHCCGHSGQLLHANYVSDTLRSGGGSSNAEETPKSSSRIFAFPYLSRLWAQSIWMVNAFLITSANAFLPFSGYPIETKFLYQRLSVLIQIFNSVAFRGTLLPETVTED